MSINARRHPHLVAALPPSAPTTPQIQRTVQELFLSPPLDDGGADGRLNRAAGVWQHFHATEQVLYAQLATTPVGVLNDVWRTFMIAAKGAGRPAWVGGELAGLAAAGVNARSAERQEQLRVIFDLHNLTARRIARRLRHHPNLSLTLLVF
ncbi:hypothetical protein B0H14DRAFT_3665669 [Mycena olivaceomarginata]|nr:hypothetical protein B0H14DRAFT_3665669 [Mycena olivaceomarginata]